MIEETTEGMSQYFSVNPARQMPSVSGPHLFKVKALTQLLTVSINRLNRCNTWFQSFGRSSFMLERTGVANSTL
jgi:hypothetical protein